MEYIEREAAIGSLLGWAAQLTETYGKNDEYVKCLESAAYNIEQIPAADVRPVVRAVWRRYSPFTDTYECSNCGEQVIDQQFRTNFCPNCGAEMEES